MTEFIPKVFISYAWTGEEYTKKIYDFVRRLRNDGVETLFDQFDLKPGQSLHSYMEKCVSDPTVTNVLIFLNPEYKKKADERKGGAGIETQIISEEVYNDLENTKFVPIIFDLEGKQMVDVLPIYLKARFFIDFSNFQNYEDQYKALVRHLYRKPAMVKNNIGTKPAWVDDPTTATYDHDKLKWVSDSMSLGNEKVTYRKSLSLLVKETEKYARLFSFASIDIDNFEEAYSSLAQLKNLVIGCINELIELDNLSSFIEEYFESFSEINSQYKNTARWKYLIFKILAHEMIVSIIAIMYKNKKYSHIFNVTTYSYLDREERDATVNFRSFFYSIKEFEINTLDKDLGRIKYGTQDRFKITGIGDYWSRNLAFDFLTLQDFVNADILLSNLNGILLGRRWFALSYVYLTDGINWVNDIVKSVKTKTSFKRYESLFGNKSETELKKLFDDDARYGYHFGYDNCFLTIPMISGHFNSKELFQDE